jgi:hypothetical protein
MLRSDQIVWVRWPRIDGARIESGPAGGPPGNVFAHPKAENGCPGAAPHDDAGRLGLSASG